DYDEQRLAAEVARCVGVDWMKVDGRRDALLDAVSQSVEFSEGWCVNGHLPAKFLLNRAIRSSGYKVAITGEGADELLAGYPHLMVDHFDQDGVDASIMQQHRASSGIMLPSANGLDLDSAGQYLGFVPTFLRAKASLGKLLRGHLQEEFLEPFRGRDAYAELLASIASRDQLSGRTRVHQSTYLWAKTALSQYILRTLGDGCESAHGVEGRVPMLDHVLFQWVKTLPAEMLFRMRDPNERGVKTCESKWILRRAVESRLPGDVTWRAKHPFVAPPLVSGGSDDASVCERLEAAVDDHPFFDTEKVKATLERTRTASPTQQIVIDPLWWTVLSSHAMLTRCNAHADSVPI
ncbi:MAG: asparagine synthase-related protein, partial [Rubripirellula sp.]